MEIIGSKWKHYKGGSYEVLAVGKDADTLETLIIYTNEDQIWVRPALEWFDVVYDKTTDPPTVSSRFELEREPAKV